VISNDSNSHVFIDSIVYQPVHPSAAPSALLLFPDSLGLASSP
jgi:hypothetical protein